MVSFQSLNTESPPIPTGLLQYMLTMRLTIRIHSRDIRGGGMSPASNLMWSPNGILWNFKLTAGLNVTDLGNPHFPA